VFVVGIITTAFVYVSVPSGFLPEEDRGVFLGIVQAPDGVSLNYTDRVAEQIDEIMQRIPEISSRFVATGIGFEGNSPARGFFYCTLKNWEERNDSKRTVQALVERINGEFAQKIPNAIVAAFNLPPVIGLGQFGGFEFQLQDRSSGRLNIDQLVASTQDIIDRANQEKAIGGSAFTQYTANAPRLELEIDRPS
jgi:HAE1 family hydrophobic/amphiphilic exporter-1